MGGGGSEGGGGDGEGGGGDGGNMKRAPRQSVQSVPLTHRATAPNWVVSEPEPPSWHKPLFAYRHVLSHHIGGGKGGGEGGGGEGGGGEGGGEGGGGEGGGEGGEK